MEVDRLEVIVEAEAKKASAELDKLIGKLGQVSAALNGLNTKGLSNLSLGVKQLSSAMATMSGVKTSDFSRLSRNIEKLGSINKSGLLNAADAIDEMVKSLNTMGSVSDDAVKIGDLASNISKLGGKSATQAITNLPLLSVSLRDFMTTVSSSPLVSENLINMTNAMANLASQGTKYGSTVKGIASATNNLTKAQKAHTTSSFSLTYQITKLVAAYYTLRRVIGFIGSSIEKSMDYTETINLFQTTYKKIGMETASKMGMEWGSATADAYAKGFIKDAETFNDMLTSSLGLDPNVMKQYQAIFAQMTNSMGLVANSSMNIANSFTMLGNDIASLWNIDTADAMKKLQSGLAGQIRPLRSLGIDISQTSLEMTALKYGITDSVISMSQAAKVQLRWLSVMDQTQVAFGDMAKTIDSPKNQIRILSQQWSNLSRSIGNVFLPVVQNVLPVINGIVIALRQFIDTMATAAGYELPDYTDSNIYTDLTGDIDGMTDATDGATDSANALKRTVMGFDSLNILGDKSNSSGATDTTGSGYSNLDDAIQQKTDSYMSKFNEEMAKMSTKAQEMSEKILPILKTIGDVFNGLSPIFIGVVTSVGAYELVKFFEGLGAKIGALANTPGLPIYLAIAAIVAIYEAVKKYNKYLREEDLAARFGDIHASLKDLQEIADELTTSKYSVNIDVFVTEKQKLSALESNIQTDLDTLNKLNWKVSVGLKLTPEEMSTYSATIEKFVTDSDAYIEQQHYVTKLAIDATIQDANFKTEISELVDKYFNGSKGEMERLGKELRAEMDNALADGIIDATEQKTINNLIKEITEYQQQIASAGFVAKLQTITLEGDLDAESYKKLFKEIQAQIDEQGKGAEGAAQQLLTVVNAQYQIDMKNATTQAQKDAIQKKYDEDVKGISDNLSQTKIEISEVGMKFVYDKIKEHWKPELDKFSVNTKDTVKTTIQGVMDEGMLGVDPAFALNSLFARTLEKFNAAAKNSGMDKAARENLETYLKELEPTSEDNIALAEKYIATGQEIPKSLSDQLTDEATLKALAGDADGIFYTMGQQMANTPEILQMLANGQITAGDLNESIILGLKNGIPDLKQQGNDLVFNLDKAIKGASTTSGKENMPTYAAKIINGYTSTFENDKTLGASVKAWLQGVNDTVNSWKVPQVSIPTPKFDASDVSASLTINYGTGHFDPSISQHADGGFVKQYAVGGIPDFGQMFIAREAGPELVGTIGGRTAVANNDQIVQSVAQGVSQAVANVLVQMQSSSGSVIHNILNLDGDVVYEAYNKAKSSNDRRFSPVMQGG